MDSPEVIRVDCEHCGEVFQAAESMAGGMTNCPRCKKAATVPGLRDRWFRFVQAGMLVAVVALTLAGWHNGGLAGALALGSLGALVCGVMYVAM
ncbi:MAG: hypothetical protein V3T86_11910 [Planctomycetota bacterium]